MSSLIKTILPTRFKFVAYFVVTGIQLLFANSENHLEIRLVILFMKKFHASKLLCLQALWNWAMLCVTWNHKIIKHFLIQNLKICPCQPDSKTRYFEEHFKCEISENTTFAWEQYTRIG